MRSAIPHLPRLVALVATASLCVCGHAREIPAELPDPDGKPGDASKPVKVYLLAGQSNMVGMGDLSGARHPYQGVYLTSDPALPTGALEIYPVGRHKIGRLAVFLPDGTPTDQPTAAGFIEVPEKGVYHAHCESAEGSSRLEIAGTEVFRRDSGAETVTREVTLEPGKRHAFKITGHQGEPPRFWLRRTDLIGLGNLETVTRHDGIFPWLIDNSGKWTVRNDVFYQEARIAKDGAGSPLSATSNGRSIGPELGFGHVMGTFLDEQVLLIKTAIGNRSLGYDFRPPSSGRNDPDSEWESLEYKLMIEGVRKTLARIDQVVPGYKGQGYEMAGLVWWQGHKDSFTPALVDEYEKNLVNLIQDVRAEFKVPKMPVVIATVGFDGHAMSETFLKILNAQMAVADPQKHPGFSGNVATVDTRGFWREIDESPANQSHHYHRNAETYLRVGDALGRAMVGLLGGEAAPLPQPPRPAPVPSAAPEAFRTPAAMAALRSIVLDGIAAAFIAEPANQPQLVAASRGERPARSDQFLNDTMDSLTAIHRAAGIHDYDWRVFGPDLRDLEWDYFSFAPQEPPSGKGGRYRQVRYPEGMEKWFATDFNPTKAGWKKGLPPFGQLAGKAEPLGACQRDICGCGEKPRTLWEHEVLLARGTFEIPAFKDGHRYRLVVGGSAHVNAGEGFALYVNGRLLAESNAGVGKRQGGQARGGHVFADFRDEFKGGKVTIAVTSFLREANGAPRGHLTVWLEEQKLPPLTASPAAKRE